MIKNHRLYGDEPTPPPIDEEEEVKGNDEDEGVPKTVQPDPR